MLKYRRVDSDGTCKLEGLILWLLTWPGDATHVEPTGVVWFEVRLHNGSLHFAFPAQGTEEVLRVHLVLDPLEAGDTKKCEEDRHNEEVTRVSSDDEPQVVERDVERLVHTREPAPHVDLQRTGKVIVIVT